MEGFDVKNEQVVIRDLEQQVLRALSLLDVKIAGPYRQACEKVPHLVQSESRVIDFLRTEDFHVLKAAHRLALYWKRRHEFFGDDRWLLPMTQTGRGALTPDQVQLLRRGFVAMTREPQAVALYDGSRLPNGLTTIPPEIIFYLNTVCTSRRAQEEGYVFFHIQHKNTSMGPRLIPKVAIQLTTCVPTRNRKVIVGQSFVPGDDHMADYCAWQSRRRTEANFQAAADYVIGKSVRDTLRGLEERGLDRACIPVSLGGDYFFTLQFDDWVRTRLSIEDAMGSAPPIPNTATANAVVAAATQDLIVNKANNTATATATVPQRKNNSSHNKTAALSVRGKTQSPTTTTTTTSSEDDDSHKNKKKEDKGQRDLLVAQRPGESREEFEKRRTYLYGKRSYERKRRRVGDLQEQIKYLQTSNQALRDDNRHLEALLVQARLLLMASSDNASVLKMPSNSTCGASTVTQE